MLDRGQKQLEAVIDAMQDGVVVFDHTGRSILINEAEARICGFGSPAEMQRELAYFAEVFELATVDGTPVPVVDWPVSRVLRGEALRDVQLRGLRRDTGQRWIFSFSGTPVWDEGRVSLAVIVTRDVTESRALEERYRHSQKMEAIGHLAGGIAHDFNNLLGVIVGYGDMLLNRADLSPGDRSRLAAMRSAAGRAASLTAKLLTFSRKQVLQLQELHPDAAVDEVMDMLRRLLPGNIETVVRHGSDVGAVRADADQLGQVVMNLALNARDAMPRGGTLVVETRNVLIDEAYARMHLGTAPGAYVMLAVSDSGHGMDADVQQRIFEPFFTTKPPGKGTGLGLSTVYGIVKHCGGSIEVYSEVGRGTTFKVYLPRIVGATSEGRRLPSPACVAAAERRSSSSRTTRACARWSKRC